MSHNFGLNNIFVFALYILTAAASWLKCLNKLFTHKHVQINCKTQQGHFTHCRTGYLRFSAAPRAELASL